MLRRPEQTFLKSREKVFQYRNQPVTDGVARIGHIVIRIVIDMRYARFYEP